MSISNASFSSVRRHLKNIESIVQHQEMHQPDYGRLKAELGVAITELAFLETRVDGANRGLQVIKGQVLQKLDEARVQVQRL